MNRAHALGYSSVTWDDNLLAMTKSSYRCTFQTALDDTAGRHNPCFYFEELSPEESRLNLNAIEQMQLASRYCGEEQLVSQPASWLVFDGGGFALDLGTFPNGRRGM